ncbi:response regulator [Konateibacter massiliensis]|uniref:response regulator n=1 Tax=Konateibacter massiliensis TaxID=2002841 RepID=UPI001F46F0F9|nr:response regulator [Konateibacter massiliensis]
MIYRVLVVDDEPSIAEGISFLIERLMPDCQVVALAFDGNEGYEKALSLKPDIILTDIQMPESDGLDMLRRLKEAGLCARFIILSGYAEFQYARTAIGLGVEEYITKPVEEEELCTVLTNTCNLVQNEKEKQEQDQKMEHTIRKYALRDILEGTEGTPETIRRDLQSLGFSTACKWYVCAIVERNRDNLNKERGLFLEEVKELSTQHLSSYKESIVISDTEDSAVIIAAFDKEEQGFYESMAKLRRALSEKLGISVNIGTGMMYRRAEEIRASFKEARCALNYKIIKGLNCVITYEQICDIDSKPKSVAEEDIKKFESCVDNMDDKGYKLVVEDIFRKLEKERDLSPTDLQRISLNLILLGIRKMSFMQIQLNEYLGKNIFSLESIEKFQTTTQLKNWIFNMLKSMNELMLKNSVPEKRDVVEEAKEYMNKNFNKNISLNEISELFFINPYYFSQLFKKKTGENYQTYLIGLRVGRAKKLLEETDLKIYEICELVGYVDINHFNKVFERIVGVKPSEYKKKLG